LSVEGLAPLAIEVAQLPFPHRERVPRTGADAVKRDVRRQLCGHLALRRPAVERAVEDALRTEILHAVDAELELLDPEALAQLLREEVLRAEAERAAVALDQVHRRGAAQTADQFLARRLGGFV